MVHRIHTGEHGANDYRIGTHVYNEVRFPGDRRDCAVCHKGESYYPPLPDDLLPSVQRQVDSAGAIVPNSTSYVAATAAACTGCHDDDATAVHVQTQSLVSSTNAADIMEACATCHAKGKEFGVDVVHARPGLN
jgi:OmcA/MtrC family decaheme c-type cytochrome